MITMKSIEQMRKLPNRENNPCFGCGPANPYGLKMEFYTDGSAVFSRLSVPAHLCGWNDIVHGGVVSTVMDEAMSWASICLLRRYILTKSMTVEFLRPVWTERPIVAEARVIEKTSEREVILEGMLYDDAGTLCARSKGTFAIFTHAGITKLGLFDAGVLDSFEEVFRVMD